MLPKIAYVSPGPFTDDSVRKEAEDILAHIDGKNPSILTQFKSVIFVAHDSPEPEDDGEEHQIVLVLPEDGSDD